MLYSIKNLANQQFLQQIKDRAQEMMIYDQVHEASDLATALEQSLDEVKDFKEKNDYLYGEYRKIIIRLKWLILSVLTDEEVLELFKDHFTQIYRIPDYDIWQKLKVVLLGYMILGDRDEFKKSLRQALLNNQEKLTSKRLVVNNQEKAPTVANWLLDYNSNLGTGAVDNLKRTQYLTTNRNLKILDQKEKDKVKLLLDLYERLKLSSFTLEGLEEDIPVDDEGMKGIIRGGIFEPLRETEEDKRISQKIKEINNIAKPAAGKRLENIIPPAPFVKGGQFKGENNAPRMKNEAEKNLDELKALAATYRPGSFERKAVEEEIEKMTNDKLPMTKK